MQTSLRVTQVGQRWFLYVFVLSWFDFALAPFLLFGEGEIGWYFIWYVSITQFYHAARFLGGGENKTGLLAHSKQGEEN